MGETSDKNCEHRKLIRQLFAIATALIENAHEVALAGQSHQPLSSTLAQNAVQLREQFDDIACLADAISFIAKHAANPSELEMD